MDTLQTLPAGKVSFPSPPPTPSINNPEMANMSCGSPEDTVPPLSRTSGVIASNADLRSATAQQVESQSTLKETTLENRKFGDFSGSCGQSEVENNQAQDNNQPGIEYSDSAIFLKNTEDIIEATSDLTKPEPCNETTPPAVVLESLDPDIEMRQDTRPDTEG